MNEYGIYNRPTDTSSYALVHDQSFLFQVLELFPLPIELFAPDGTSVFVNQAFLECLHIPHSTDIVGKLNVLMDPYLNSKLGLADQLQRAFAGEVLSLHDLRVPLEEINLRYQARDSMLAEFNQYQSIFSFPLWNENGAIAYIVTLFITRHIYQARSAIIKAKEYIEKNWFDDFDKDKLCEVVNLSRNHLTRLFKQAVGKTPYSYYLDIKSEKIKEALRDPNLTISEAFASCGADYHSSLARVFRNKVGMTPSQYRQTLLDSARAEVGVTHDTAARSEVDSREHSSACVEHSFCGNIEHLFQVLEWFPIPINVITSGGDVAYVNRAFLEMWNISEPAQIVGVYNLLRDPVVNERQGYSEYVRRVVKGEIVFVPDVRVPLEDFTVWYEGSSTRYDIESMYTDILSFPIRNPVGLPTYFVNVFLTTRFYQGRSDIARAKEYIENHWLEEFDIDKVAEIVHLSRSHLVRLFKQHIGKTPYSFYQEIKIDRLKLALRDPNMSVSEAFASCGVDYHSNLARLFKEKVGMTPSEYKRTVGR